MVLGLQILLHSSPTAAAKSGAPGSLHSPYSLGPAHRVALSHPYAACQAQLSRRVAVLAALVPVITGVPGAGAAASAVLDAPTLPPCASRVLDPAVASLFTRSVYEAVKELQVLPEEQFQLEAFKLRSREYKYYYEVNAAQLPRVPDLSDMSGGLSNRTYFNFVSYIAWKVAAAHVQTPQGRTQLCQHVGNVLLGDLALDLREDLTREASSTGTASAAALVRALQALLDRLKVSGYLCSYQVTWGSMPGGWPADWAASEPQMMGSPSAGDAVGAAFQVRISEPADIRGAVALRAEEDGFWSRHVSSMLSHLLASAGYSQATVDEYFYQDYWSGPSAWGDRLLLLLGDPLQQVDVPWTPTTLVQNWQL